VNLKGRRRILRKRDLPTAGVFDEFSRYWAEIADDDNTEKQVNMVKSLVPIEGLVLDMGCGSGKHTVLLAKASYNMVGLDVSPRLLAIAKRRSVQERVNAAFVRADMRFLPFRPEVFAAELSLDSSFGYLASESEDLRSLKETAKTTVHCGVFLVDVFNRERMVRRHRRSFGFGFQLLLLGLLPRVPYLAGLFTWREYPSFCLLQKRNANAKSGLLRDLWVFRDKKTGKIAVAEHVVRLYGFSQLKALIEDAGLGVQTVFGSYEGNEYAESSSRLIVVVVKAAELKFRRFEI
jgi:SAM-dependent methyltransferase